MRFEEVVRIKDCIDCPIKEECERFRESGNGQVLHIEIEERCAPMLAIKMQEDRESFRKWVFAKAREVGVNPFELTKGIIVALRSLSKKAVIMN